MAKQPQWVDNVSPGGVFTRPLHLRRPMLGGVFSRVMFEQYRKISWYIGTTIYNVDGGNRMKLHMDMAFSQSQWGEKKETNQNPTPDLPIDM